MAITPTTYRILMHCPKFLEHIQKSIFGKFMLGCLALQYKLLMIYNDNMDSDYNIQGAHTLYSNLAVNFSSKIFIFCTKLKKSFFLTVS